MNFTIVKNIIAEENIRMESLCLPSEEWIRVAHREGEYAVVRLFFETIGKLAEYIQRFEDQKICRSISSDNLIR